MGKLAGYHEAGKTKTISSAQLAAGTASSKAKREKEDASFTITFKGVNAEGRSTSPSNGVCVKSV